MNRNVKHWIYHLCCECEIGFVVYWLLRNVKRILKISFFVVKTMRFSRCCTGINFVCTPRKPTLWFTIISRRTATHISPGLWVSARARREQKCHIHRAHTRPQRATKMKRKSYCLLAYNSFAVFRKWGWSAPFGLCTRWMLSTAAEAAMTAVAKAADDNFICWWHFNLADHNNSQQSNFGWFALTLMQFDSSIYNSICVTYPVFSRRPTLH